MKEFSILGHPYLYPYRPIAYLMGSLAKVLRTVC